MKAFIFREHVSRIIKMNYFFSLTAAGLLTISVLAHAQPTKSAAPNRSEQKQIEDGKQKAANQRARDCLESARRNGQKEASPEFRRSVSNCMKG
jgi:hypothetical protein